jgi:hypothetical protein
MIICGKYSQIHLGSKGTKCRRKERKIHPKSSEQQSVGFIGGLAGVSARCRQTFVAQQRSYAKFVGSGWQNSKCKFVHAKVGMDLQLRNVSFHLTG